MIFFFMVPVDIYTKDMSVLGLFILCMHCYMFSSQLMFVCKICTAHLMVCFYTLQLSNEHSSLIWTTTPEHADHLLKLSPDSFVDAVNDALVCDMHLHTSEDSR